MKARKIKNPIITEKRKLSRVCKRAMLCQSGRVCNAVWACMQATTPKRVVFAVYPCPIVRHFLSLRQRLARCSEVVC